MSTLFPFQVTGRPRTNAQMYWCQAKCVALNGLLLGFYVACVVSALRIYGVV